MPPPPPGAPPSLRSEPQGHRVADDVFDPFEAAAELLDGSHSSKEPKAPVLLGNHNVGIKKRTSGWDAAPAALSATADVPNAWLSPSFSTYSSLTVLQLKAQLKARGISLSGLKLKADILSRLEEEDKKAQKKEESSVAVASLPVSSPKPETNTNTPSDAMGGDLEELRKLALESMLAQKKAKERHDERRSGGRADHNTGGKSNPNEPARSETNHPPAQDDEVYYLSISMKPRLSHCNTTLM